MNPTIGEMVSPLDLQTLIQVIMGLNIGILLRIFMVLETLPIRKRKHSENTLRLAGFLKKHLLVA